MITLCVCIIIITQYEGVGQLKFNDDTLEIRIIILLYILLIDIHTVYFKKGVHVALFFSYNYTTTHNN